MILQNAADTSQAEAGALARSFGCEERLENLFPEIGGNARARIGHANDHERPGFDAGMRPRLRFAERAIPGGHRQGTAARHGIAGIDAEIEQHLVNLRRVAAGGPELGVDLLLKLD